jgi:hypothetical protein
MKNFEQIGTEIGELVEIKNAAYGSSFAKCGEFMRLLYPDGVAAEKLEDALLLVRVFDKMMRIATDRDALGESPWADIVGYGILGVHQHQPKEETTGPCKTTRESASGQDAGSNAKAQRDSAAPPASAPTTTPANAPAACAPSLQPNSCSSELASASAPNATETASHNAAASQSGIDLIILQLATLMRKCNEGQRCARCGCIANRAYLSVVFWGETFLICHECISSITFYPWKAVLRRHSVKLIDGRSR